jgi:hypothetical protein
MVELEAFPSEPSSGVPQFFLILSLLRLKSIAEMCRINYVICVMMNESIRQIPEKPLPFPVAEGFFYMYIGRRFKQ